MSLRRFDAPRARDTTQRAVADLQTQLDALEATSALQTGTATLVGGEALVPCVGIDASARVLVSRREVVGVDIGNLRVSAVTPDESFTVRAELVVAGVLTLIVLDVGSFDYAVFNP